MTVLPPDAGTGPGTAAQSSIALGWAGDHQPVQARLELDRKADPDSLVVPMDTGERIHYLDWGGTLDHGLPPLLLLHELSQTAWSWAPVARRLRPMTRVVAVDLRGHGLSEAPRAGYELDSLAADVLTVMAANGWGLSVGGPPAVLAGHGVLGGAVAATAAALQPDSVAGLALIDGGWEELAAATGMSASEYVVAVAEPPEVLASMQAFLDDRAQFDRASWDDDQERAARAQVDQKHAGHVAFVARPLVVKAVVEALFAFRPDEVLPRAAAPLLLLVAESGSADDDVSRERRLALDDVVRQRSMGAAGLTRIATFTGSGHNLMRYRPGELSAELAALLEVASGG